LAASTDLPLHNPKKESAMRILLDQESSLQAKYSPRSGLISSLLQESPASDFTRLSNGAWTAPRQPNSAARCPLKMHAKILIQATNGLFISQQLQKSSTLFNPCARPDG
jgi:hypothetical protein